MGHLTIFSATLALVESWLSLFRKPNTYLLVIHSELHIVLFEIDMYGITSLIN